jgi:hypothetical protein
MIDGIPAIDQWLEVFIAGRIRFARQPPGNVEPKLSKPAVNVPPEEAIRRSKYRSTDYWTA